MIRLMERRMTAAARLARGAQASAHVDGSVPAAALDPDDARLQLVELVRMYSDGTLGLPSRFFPAPEEPVVQLTPVGGGPLGNMVVDLS